MGKHIYPIVTIIFISIIVGIFINGIISNKTESNQSLSPYEQEQQEMKYEVDNNTMDNAHDMCSGEVIEEDCISALQSCLENTSCKQMLNKYSQEYNVDNLSLREIIIRASKARMDHQRKQLGLPYEEW